MEELQPFQITPERSGDQAKREGARDRARNWKLAHRQTVSPEELIQCRDKIRNAFTIRGDDWIICLGRRDQTCGQMLQVLRAKGAGAHLAEHGFSDDQQYRELWGYSKSTKLICRALARSRREQAAASGNLKPEAGCDHRTPPSQRGRKMSREFSQKQADRMSGTRDLDRDTRILRLWLLESQPIEEIASQVTLSQGRVHVILQRIFGMRVKQRVQFAHGQVVTAEFVEHMAEAFNLKKKEIARVLKFNVDKLKFPVLHRDDRSLTSQAANFCLKIEKELFELLLRFSNEKPHHFRIVVPGLDDYYERVIEAARRLRADVEFSCLRDLCARAQGANRGARTLISILPCLVVWLKKHTEYSGEQPFKLAQRFIADEYGVSLWIVERALKLGQTQDDAGDRKIIRVMLLPKKKAKPGPAPKDATEKRDFEIREKLARLLPVFQNFLEKKKASVSRHDREEKLKSELIKLGYSELQVDRGLENALDSKNSKVAARYFVSGALRLQYCTVKSYAV